MAGAPRTFHEALPAGGSRARHQESRPSTGCGTLGLEFLGPQSPDGWQPSGPQPDVPPDTKNVPTWARNGRKPEEANRQFDYTIASRGFHERLKMRALNRADEWGPSDHCRLPIEVEVG